MNNAVKLLICLVVLASCVTIVSASSTVRAKLGDLAFAVGSFASADWGSEWSDVDAWRTDQIWNETPSVDTSTEFDSDTTGSGTEDENQTEQCYTSAEYKDIDDALKSAKSALSSLQESGERLQELKADRIQFLAQLKSAETAYQKDKGRLESSKIAQAAAVARAESSIQKKTNEITALEKKQKLTTAERRKLATLYAQRTALQNDLRRVNQVYQITTANLQSLADTYQQAKTNLEQVDVQIAELEALYSPAQLASTQASVSEQQTRLNALTQRPQCTEEFCPDGSVMVNGYCSNNENPEDQICQELGLFDGWKIGGYIGPFGLGNSVCGERLGSCLKNTSRDGDVSITNDASTGNWVATWKCVNEKCQYEETCRKTGTGSYSEWRDGR